MLGAEGEGLGEPLSCHRDKTPARPRSNRCSPRSAQRIARPGAAWVVVVRGCIYDLRWGRLV